MVARLITAVFAGLVLAQAENAKGQDASDQRWRDECKDHREWHSTVRYCEVRVERLTPGGALTGSLSIDAGQNGAIEVVATKGDSIVIHERIETEAATEADARDLASQVHVVSTGNSVHADGPLTGRRREWSVSYRVTVPSHSDFSLTAVNGPLSVEGVTGQLTLHAVNGPIDLENVGGDVRARAQNGPLDIRLTGTGWSGAGLDAETENGPVELSLSKAYAAHVETSTVNGPMEIDFPVTVQGRFDPRRIALDVGGGGKTVRAVTTNGPVHVSRLD